jgi:hypothetical protein
VWLDETFSPLDARNIYRIQQASSPPKHSAASTVLSTRRLRYAAHRHAIFPEEDLEHDRRLSGENQRQT